VSHDRSKLFVLAKRCDQCLFSKGKIVSDERRVDVLATCARRGVHFVCHKDRNDRKAVCRGFYDRDPKATAAMRLAPLVGALHFIAEEDL
jgi:hypothetical protein